MTPEAKDTSATIAAYLIMGIVKLTVLFILTWFFQESWNSFLTPVFGAARLTYNQALGGLVLLSILATFLKKA